MTDFPAEQLKDLLSGIYEPETPELGKTVAQSLIALHEQILAVEAVRAVQAEILAASLTKIALAPGDVLHVKSPHSLGNEYLGHIHKHVKPFFPNNNVILSDAHVEINISVIHPETGNPGER